MASGTSGVGGHGRRKGRCKWFNVAKGWGFITPDDQGQDVFVHQSVIQMSGFRSLGDDEEVEFECKTSDKGLEATVVTGLSGNDCRGSHRRPVSKKRFRKIRCFNCGEFANHVAAKCSMGPQPKRCHNCKSVNHLIADCPLRDDKMKGSTNNNNNNSRTQNGGSSNGNNGSDASSQHHNGTNGGEGGGGGGGGNSQPTSESQQSPSPCPSPGLSSGPPGCDAETLTVTVIGNNGNSSPSPVESSQHCLQQVRPSSTRGTFIIVTNSGTIVTTSTSSVACQQPISTTTSTKTSSANDGSISYV